MEKKLNELIAEFKGSGQGNLAYTFESLAKHFLFGGYFEVGNKQIYLRDIEFYYHDEDVNIPNRVEDKKMYHISDNNPKEKLLKYFIQGSFHEHVSGLDFCFENKELKFRASILMRAVEVREKDTIYIEKRPTYVPGVFLMGNSVFGNGFNIKWHDEPIPSDAVLPSPIGRKNLPDGKKYRYSLLQN